MSQFPWDDTATEREERTLEVLCAYCHVAPVLLTGDEAADYVEASDERKPGHLCPTCIETCRAHAKQMRQHAEWVAEGSTR